MPVTAVLVAEPDLRQLCALIRRQDRRDGLERFHSHCDRLAQQLTDFGLLGLDGRWICATQHELAQLSLARVERLRELLPVCGALREELPDAAHLIVRESERLLEPTDVTGRGPGGSGDVGRASHRRGGEARAQDQCG